MDDFFNEYEDEIRDEIYSRNDSVMAELIRHTDDIPIRVKMLSNHDWINSNWFESQGGYRYEESYFGNMVDSLNLNPSEVKKLLTGHGYKVYGRFPNRKNRNGKEQFSYEQFYEELINSCCGSNMLTYIGKISLKELYDTGFSLKELIIPKGNCCGLFSSIYGGGSLLEMELRQDVRLNLEVKGCHGFRFRLDDERSYECSIRHVYGVDDSFFRRCDKFSSGNESNINNKIIRIMAKYKVKARYIFEGPYTVVAEDHDEAERMVTEDCGLVLGGNIHTTRDDDEVADWNFGCHPDLQILSIRQKGGKSPKLVFGDRIEELREEIIDAIRQLLHAHAMKTIRFQEKDCDSVWVVWFNKNGDPYECRVTGLRVTA